MDRQRFTITLEGIDDVTPVIIRLRHALKLLLRAFRLKCVQIEPATDSAASPAIGETMSHRKAAT